MDVVHRPEFYITRKHNVSENESVSVLRCETETPTLLYPSQIYNINHSF
jgi:hypothetical protein